jgi:hypothetical protein
MKKDFDFILALGYVVSFVFLLFGRLPVSLMIILATSVVLAVSNYGFPSGRALINPSFLQRVQHAMHLDFVKVGIKKAKPRRVIAGFMLPLLPFFVRIRYPEKKKIKEAVVHELSHIWWFIYGGQLLLFILLVFIMSRTSISIWLRIFVILMFLLFQEYLAFKKTGILAKDFGIKDIGKFGLKTVVKYSLIYFTMMYGFLFIFLVLGVNLAVIWCFVLFILLVIIIDRGFYYVFKFIDMLWKVKKTKDL